MDAKSSISKVVHAAVPALSEFRLPRLAGLLSLFSALFAGLVSAMMFAFAIWGFTQQWVVGLFITVIAFFCAGLSVYAWRDFRGKFGLRVVFDRDAVTFDLPATRSLIHHLPAQRLTIPYNEIAAIETRLEAYRSLGMAQMQRAYALRRRSGDLIFLFEDRALAAPLKTSLFEDVAAKLAARAGVPLRDVGMVKGGGGFLGVWGTRAPDWSVPSLGLDRQTRLWRHAAVTGAVGVAIIAAIMLGLVLRAMLS
jgi:hypothetical protein